MRDIGTEAQRHKGKYTSNNLKTGDEMIVNVQRNYTCITDCQGGCSLCAFVPVSLCPF